MACSSARATWAPMQRCGPNPNTSVLDRRAVDPEVERVVEHVLVAVGRCPVEGHLVPGADLLPVQLAVLGRGAGEVADGRDPTQDLLDGGRAAARAGPATCPTGRGYSQKACMPPAIASRVVWLPGFDQELAVGDELCAGQGHAVDLALHQLVTRSSWGSCRRCSIICLKYRWSSPRARMEVCIGSLAGTPVLGIVLADDLVGPAEVVLPVGAGHAEDPGDDRDGERRCEHVDEVALADLTVGRRRGRPGRRRSARSARCASGRRCLRNFLFTIWRMGPCSGGSR